MDWWTFVWVFVSLAILISILESVHRKAKRKRAAILNQQEMQAQIRSHQYHVYTIQTTPDRTANMTPPMFTADPKADDLPPNYEEVVRAIPRPPISAEQAAKVT